MTRGSQCAFIAAAALLVVATGGCFSPCTSDNRLHLMLRPGVSRPSDTDRGSVGATTFAVGIGKWDWESSDGYAEWWELEYSRVPFGTTDDEAMSRYSIAICGDGVDFGGAVSCGLGWSHQRTDDGQSWLTGPFIDLGSAGYPLGRVRARIGGRLRLWLGEDVNGFDMSTECELRAEIIFIL